MLLTYPYALQRPGPAYKVWPQTNSVSGVIEHSAEGSATGLWAQLDGPADVSWHFSILKSGQVYQHYLLNASPWHAGGQAANTRLIGVEHEGVAGEVLTGPQLASSVALTRWIAEQGGWTLQRSPAGSQTLYEHREVNPATTCPNGRIPWAAYLPAPVPPGGVTKLTGSAAIDAFMRVVQQFSPAVGQQEGRFIGTLNDAPPGFDDVVIRIREGG